MDKLKEYWEIAKKQHFWILCGLAILAPLIASVIANNNLSKVYGDQKSKINSTNSKLDSLIGGEHANDEWVKHVEEETERLRTNVERAWETLYKQQQSALKWPSGLQADFIAAFSKPAANDDPRALEPLCERYQNYVKTELSHMADIVKAEWDPGQGGGGAGHERPGAHRGGQGAAGGGADNPEEPKKTYIVYWDPADEERLVAAYDWQDPPSPLDVRYAQEELWVLEAICKSIDRTNVGATGDFDAVVREIHETLIGYDATNKFPLGEGSGRIERSHKSGPGNGQVAPQQNPQNGPAAVAIEPKRPMRHRTTEEGALGGHFRPPGRGFARGGPNAAPAPGVPAGPADPEAWLKDGRYVDSKGKPLSGSEWAASTSPEYNQMAFKLTIVADEQQWQKLLVEFCNSPLPLEVREVRINASDREEGGGRGRPGRAQGRREDEGSGVLHNVTLEISGVAYLINPPNLAKLGIKAADATAGAVAPAPAPAGTTPPAATTPAVTTPATTPPAAATPTTTAPPTTGPATTAPAPATVPPAATPPATTPPATTPPAATTPATAPPAATTPAKAPPATAPATVPPTTAPPATVPPTTAPAKK